MFRLLVVALAVVPARAAEDKPFTGPWDVPALQKPPKVTWVDTEGPLRKLYYEAEPRNGKPTRVFAYYAEPAERKGRRLPGMVLVHGGGGKAFAEWARLWANRGYAALAMDLGARGEDGKRLPDGGPEQDDDSKFPRTKTDPREAWSYHAVAAVIRGVSILRSLPQVDPDRIGITGISWGGYLTCIVAGLDDRLKVAIPVYGCGFLHHNSTWLDRFAAMPPDWRKEWVDHFDPSHYVGQAKCPVLFVNGTNDFAYPLDSYQKTYRLVQRRGLCVTVRMPHGHAEGWKPVEIGLFADHHLRTGEPLAVFEGDAKVVRQDKALVAEAKFTSTVPVSRAELHWTTQTSGPWKDRKWQSKPAGLANGRVWAELPADERLIYFLTVTDDRKATVSTPHQFVEP